MGPKKQDMTGRCTAFVATVANLVLLGLPLAAHAQQAPGVSDRPIQQAARIAAVASGSIHGLVKDETGTPIAGAMVSAVGATPTVAVTDRDGRFNFESLAPGPYFVRVHLKGYIAPRAQMVDVRPSTRAASTISLRRADESTVLEAGLIHSDPAPPTYEPANAPAPESPATQAGDESELSWRLRHIRRGVLKESELPDVIVVEDRPSDDGRSFARLATGFFAETPFSGQFNLLTTTSFDSPRQLFTPDNLSRGVAYVRLGAPVGLEADWSIRGALNQADISSWILAGAYRSHAPSARHHYEIGMSYSTQRYDGGNPLALRDVTDGSRNAGALYAMDSFTIAPAITASYGVRYARYDYLDNRNLFSPRVALTVTPASHTRVTGSLIRNEQAPGAEEFLPPTDAGIWLPPQRTFSSIRRRGGFDAERATRLSVEVERDLPGSTISVGAFREIVEDQLVTLFGIDLPFQPSAELGHYVVGNAGDVNATGCIAELRTRLAGRVSGSVAYSVINAMLTPGLDAPSLSRTAPTVMRTEGERIHDVSTAIETQVPETSTRVLVLYRLSNGFAEEADRTGFDSRFDVQVRQGLPFLNFTSAQWEMLVAVRNFFHETSAEQTVYDELLVVHPPKRIVGGVTMRF